MRGGQSPRAEASRRVEEIHDELHTVFADGWGDTILFGVFEDMDVLVDADA